MLAENGRRISLDKKHVIGSKTLSSDRDNYNIGCIIGHSSFGSSTIQLAELKDKPINDNSLYVVQISEIDKLTTKDLMCMQNALQLSNELNHPSILLFNSSFVTDDGYIWTVYPLFNYGSCHDVMAAEYKHGLPMLFVSMILRSVLIALDYLHKLGIIHRAVKANHMLINSNGKICLSGLHYCMKLPRNEKVLHLFPNHAKNMLPWVAPEILQQSVEGYNERSDMYSVGITTVELVTGTIPFSKLRPTEILLQKLRGVIPELPDKATLEFLQLDVSASQTSLEGLEQTNDMMSSPSPLNSLSAKRVRSLKQLVENCVQTNPYSRLSASQLRHSTYMRHMKRKTKDKDVVEMLKPLCPIQEFIASSDDTSFLKKMSSVSIEDTTSWDFD